LRPDVVVVLSDGRSHIKVLAMLRHLQAGRENPAKIIAVGYGRDFVGKSLGEQAGQKIGRFFRRSQEWAARRA